MLMTDSLLINPELAIPLRELHYRFTRSGGPGGQHVNKTATQVELTFDVLHSPSLNPEQRARLIRALKKRIDHNGILHLVSHSTRSQLDNREDVTHRFVELLASALKPAKKRKPTKPSQAAKEKRLAAKKMRGESKRGRAVSKYESE